MALALYRKYRPRTFAEVIGQEHVTEPLSQALRSGRLHHAYLFSGPRGCGKTSSARILARSLNCEQGPTPEPCGVCGSCRSLANDGAGSIDVIEIDAASHGGVDDARELREKAFFAPASSRYKIYVIDEAHMVSSAGFNALLKLVEEPPDYVKFIFATTEPEKVLGTIRSRTHHYPFRLIPPATLRPYLQQLTEAEGVHVDPAVLPLVVRAGGGSARDTLSVLDQLIAGAGPEGVDYARAVALLGVTDVALIDEMCDALAAGDGAAAYQTIDRVAEAGHDPRRFASDLLERFRDLIVLQQVPDAVTKGLIDGPADQLEQMGAQATRLGPAALSRCADIVHNGLVEMRGTTAPRLLLELITARMLLPGADDSSGALLQRLERMERRLTLTSDPDSVRPEHPSPTTAAPAASAPGSVAGVGLSAARAAAAAARRPGAPGAAAEPAQAASAAPTSPTPTSPAASPNGASAATPDIPRRDPGTDHAGPATDAPVPPSGAVATTPDAAQPAAPEPRRAEPPQAPSPHEAAPSLQLAESSPQPAGLSPQPAGLSPQPVGSSLHGAAPSRQPAAPSPQHAGPSPQHGGPLPQHAGPSPQHGGPLPQHAGPSPHEPQPAGPGQAGPGQAWSEPEPEFLPADADPQPTAPRRPEPAGLMPDAPEEPGLVSDTVPGQLSAASIREVWPEIMVAVSRKSKKIAALAQGATVRDLEGQTVVLTFRFPAHARMVSAEPQLIADALYEALGGRWQIRCDVAGEGGASPGSGGRPAPRGPQGGGPAQGPQGGGGPGPQGGGPAQGPQGGGGPGPQGGGPAQGPQGGGGPGPQGGGPAQGPQGGGGPGPQGGGPAQGPQGGGGPASRDSGPVQTRPTRDDAPVQRMPAQASASRETAGGPQAARQTTGGPQAARQTSGGPQGGRQSPADEEDDGGWPEPVKPGGLATPPASPHPPTDEDDGGWPEPVRPGARAADVRSSASEAAFSPGSAAMPESGPGPASADGSATGQGAAGDPTFVAGQGSIDSRPADGTAAGRGPTAPGAVDGSGPGSASSGEATVGASEGAAERIVPRNDPPGASGAGGASPSNGGHAVAPAQSSGLSGARAAAPSAAIAAARAAAARGAAPAGTRGSAQAPARGAAQASARGAAQAPARGAGSAAAPAPAGAPMPAGAPAPARPGPAGPGARPGSRAPARPGGRPGAARSGSSDAGAWADGSPTEEAPYDPEYDGPAKADGAAWEGFDPGDEPLDDVIDEKTARQSSEQQAVQLLQEVFGAEKISEP
ncbi:DNA polymerase-3 subunit gamma/tau [Pseudosporangium ferrugineum]|uniref:DNA polymerase III subunit gamma/tau n=1 Tax=Pseudosporangium ferrugineum TaxID=439699 RepID=A0A2T0S6A9_9ACTN|nr:DNA polymerase-3 subunit gamma/tau [Pseudosporangium ferrugineum]